MFFKNSWFMHGLYSGTTDEEMRRLSQSLLVICFGHASILFQKLLLKLKLNDFQTQFVPHPRQYTWKIEKEQFIFKDDTYIFGDRSMVMAITQRLYYILWDRQKLWKTAFLALIAFLGNTSMNNSFGGSPIAQI